MKRIVDISPETLMRGVSRSWSWMNTPVDVRAQHEVIKRTSWSVEGLIPSMRGVVNHAKVSLKGNQ